MGLGNFLHGIVAQVNPFDNGKTFGSYNPPKKKPEPGDPGYQAPINNANTAPAIQAPVNQPKAQTPQNLFAGLNQSLQLPGSPSSAIPVVKNPNTIPTVPPPPGTVIKPIVQSQPIQTNPAPTPPPQPQHTSFLGHIGNALKTTGQVGESLVSAVPAVTLAAGRAATGIVQGVTQLPHIVTAATATGTKELAKTGIPGTGIVNRAAQDINTGTKNVTNVVNKPLNAVGHGLDVAAQVYNRIAPEPENIGINNEVYKKSQIPLNVIAGLLTLGTGSAGEAAGAAGKAGDAAESGGLMSKITDFLNAPRSSNPDNLIAKTAQAVSRPATPVVQALNAPISTARSGITALNNLRSVTPVEREIAGAGETGNVLSDADLNDLTAPPTQIPVTQSQPITVNAPPSEATPVPVTVTPPPTGAPIIEVGGDRPGAVNIPTPQEVAAQRAADQFRNAPPANPDQSVSGMNSPSNVVTTADKNELQNTLDDKLASNQLTPEEHADLSDQLSKVPAQDAPVPKGQKIEVKQANPIPVTSQTEVPAGLPETPGAVRPTVAVAPANAEAQAVAAAPTVANPVSLPKETQEVLDNPKQFNKRQVQAARNQRKMAQSVAKANEGTQDALSRMETASPAAQSDEGFVPTGKMVPSANGGSVQSMSRSAEMAQATKETAQVSPKDVIKTARENQATNGQFNRRDIRNVMAMFENKRIPTGTPEFNEAKAILKEDGATTAQALAARGSNVIRRTASSDQLTSQFESKLYRMVSDPSKVDSSAFDAIDYAESKFTAARDDATAAYNRFTEAPTHSNATAYHAAQDAADQADKDAKMTEYTVAQKALKGNKDGGQVKELQKMAAGANMYQMDGIDASMLSGTGTFSRNLVNAAIGGGEEGVFGGIASRIAGKLTGEDVGGGIGRGTLKGFGEGVKNIVDSSKARASAAGRNPLEHIKNFATTGNELGDSVIDSQVKHNVIDHYTQDLKSQGYKGQELTDRASIEARQDPDGLGKVYAGAARASAGLGSGIAKSGKAETYIRDAISNAVTGGHPNQVSDIAAKLITRMTVGFPTAIGRSLSEGAKRASLGSLNALKLFGKASRDDPAVRAQIIKDSIKQAGSGATTGMVFYGLGKSGLVTGAYPTDPNERAQWQREGITENSIKIGGNYYQLPSYLGVAALPALFSASLGRNDGDVAKSVADMAKAIPSILPTDQASNVLDWINGKTNTGKFLTQTGAAATRALTPAGALLNQVAKSFDPTQNDTTTGTALNQFMDKVMTGIPGENKFANIPDKTDDAGNVLHNPSALPLALGAASTTQEKGVEETKTNNDQTNSAIKDMTDTGAFKDPNIKKVLNTAQLKLYNEVTSGKQLDPQDLTKLQTAMVRGVSSDGSDTAYLEKEQYGSNITALTVKRQLMAADPTTKPSDLAKMDTAIKRGTVYQDNKIPYDQIQNYEKTSLSDWRAMGDPKSDSYDPAQYQALWNIDQQMTKAGVSYKTNDPTLQKYSSKAASSGSGGSSSSSTSTDFGKLKAGAGAPTVQAYQSVDQSTGQVPVISVTRPNIVHKISSSG